MSSDVRQYLFGLDFEQTVADLIGLVLLSTERHQRQAGADHVACAIDVTSDAIFLCEEQDLVAI